MTHIQLKDGETVAGTLCVDRSLGTCIILQASLDEVDKLLGIAKANSVPEVTMIVPEESVEELLSKGWQLTSYKVVTHK